MKMDNKQLIVCLMFLFIRKMTTTDPCVDYTKLDEPDRSAAFDSLSSYKCDSAIDEGWYRSISGAGGDMVTEAVPPGRCSTNFPLWINDVLPIHNQSKEVKVCQSTHSSSCGREFKIRVKNCGSYNVYELKQTSGCSVRYCFGTELKCPVGKSSQNGFSPGCQDVPSIPLLLSVATGLTSGPDHNKPSPWGYTVHHKVLKFDCNLQIVTNDKDALLFMVEWYIESNPVDSFTDKSFAELEDTYLTGAKWKGKAHMGFHVTCQMRVKYKTGTVYGPVFKSDPFYAGFKVDKSNVAVTEGGTTDIQIWLTVPFGCARSNKDSDEKCPTLDLNLRESNYQRSHLSSENQKTCTFDGDLGFVNLETMNNKRCILSFQHTEWNKSLTIKIAGISDSKYNKHNKVAHVRLEAHEEIGSDPGFAGASLPDIVVIIHDGDMKYLKGKKCKSANDPQITTFDGRCFQNQHLGEHILFVHNTLPIEVHTMVTGCESSQARSGACNCGVAIRNDNAMFIANFCGHISNHYTSSPSNKYIEKVDCDDRYMTIKNTGTQYEVTLPTGTSITIDYKASNNIITEVLIKPSIRDWKNSAGLCGYLDGKSDNDMKLRDGSVTYSFDDFKIHWRLTDTTQSLFAPNVQIPQANVNLRQYCKCTADTSPEVLQTLCELSEAMLPCTNTQIDAKSAQGFFKQCAKSRTKRDAKRDAEDDDDEVFDKIPITYDDDYLKIPQPATWSNGWNESLARQACTAHFAGSKMVDLCKTFIPDFNEDITNTIQECVNDIQNTGGITFMDIALEGLGTGCVVEAKKFENLTDTNSTSGNSSKSALDDILDASCPNNCSDQGHCIEEKCECFNDFYGNECNLRRSDAPSVQKNSNSGLCKTDQKACHSYGIIGNFMIPGLLKCKARHFKIFEDAHVEVSGSDLVFPGTYINEFSCKCVIPGSRKRRAANPDTVVAEGYHMSVSNDGTTYSEEITFVNYDSTCYECNTTDIACSLIGVYDTCHPKAPLKNENPDPTKENYGGIIGGILGGIICIFVVTVSVIVIIKKKNKKRRKIETSVLDLHNTRENIYVSPSVRSDFQRPRSARSIELFQFWE